MCGQKLQRPRIPAHIWDFTVDHYAGIYADICVDGHMHKLPGLGVYG